MGELKSSEAIAGLGLSSLSLGTMRFADKGLSREDVSDLIGYLYSECGIDTHHSSHEYSSYGLYAEGLAHFKKKQKPASGIFASCLPPISGKMVFHTAL
jgi:hypothetical protein